MTINVVFVFIENTLKKSCDYENGICGWTQDRFDQFDWEIHSKETSTRFTGPSNDHTYGNSSEGKKKSKYLNFNILALSRSGVIFTGILAHSCGGEFWYWFYNWIRSPGYIRTSFLDLTVFCHLFDQKCRVFSDKDETVYHITECSRLALKDYKNIYDWMEKLIH